MIDESVMVLLLDINHHHDKKAAQSNKEFPFLFNYRSVVLEKLKKQNVLISMMMSDLETILILIIYLVDVDSIDFTTISSSLLNRNQFLVHYRIP